MIIPLSLPEQRPREHRESAVHRPAQRPEALGVGPRAALGLPSAPLLPGVPGLSLSSPLTRDEPPLRSVPPSALCNVVPPGPWRGRPGLYVNESEVAATAASWARSRTQGQLWSDRARPTPRTCQRPQDPGCYDALLGSQGWGLGVQSSPGEPWVLQAATSASRAPHIWPHPRW